MTARVKHGIGIVFAVVVILVYLGAGYYFGVVDRAARHEQSSAASEAGR